MLDDELFGNEKIKRNDLNRVPENSRNETNSSVAQTITAQNFSNEKIGKNIPHFDPTVFREDLIENNPFFKKTEKFVQNSNDKIDTNVSYFDPTVFREDLIENNPFFKKPEKFVGYQDIKTDEKTEIVEEQRSQFDNTQWGPNIGGRHDIPEYTYNDYSRKFDSHSESLRPFLNGHINVMTDDPERLRELLKARRESPNNIDLFKINSSTVENLFNDKDRELTTAFNSGLGDWIKFHRSLNETIITDINSLISTMMITEKCLQIDNLYFQNEYLKEEMDKLKDFSEHNKDFFELNNMIISVLKENGML